MKEGWFRIWVNMGLSGVRKDCRGMRMKMSGIRGMMRLLGVWGNKLRKGVEGLNMKNVRK